MFLLTHTIEQYGSSNGFENNGICIPFGEHDASRYPYIYVSVKKDLVEMIVKYLILQ